MIRTMTQRKTIGMATLLACALQAPHAAHAATHTWTNVTAGTFNWSNVTNWDAAGVPPSDGTADVVFSNSPSATAYAYTVTVDAPWAGSTGAVRSLTFLSGGSANSSDTLVPGAGVTNLTIGAGGVKLDTTQTWSTRIFNINLILSVSQPWFIEMSNYASENRYVQILKDVASPPGVNWTIGGRGKTQFESGSSTGFLGQVTLNGYVNLYAANQYGRLGANPIIVDNGNGLVAAGSVGAPRLVFNDLSAGAVTMRNAFVLNLTNSAGFYMNFGQGPSAFMGTGATLDLTNTLSGSIKAYTFSVQSGYPVWDDRYVYKFSGNNAALQGPTNPVTVGAALWVNRVAAVLNGPHALGTNNSLAIVAGPANNSIIGAPSSVLATDGNTVNANILIPSAPQGMPNNNNAQTPVVLGLYGTGAVTFAGSVYAQGNQNNGAAGCQAHVPRLTAPSNGIARFTGNFSNDGTNGAPMQVLGLGDVALHGTNTGFKAQTLIRSGRLLLGSSAAVATNLPINLGDAVSLPAGGPVRLATVLPPSGGTTTWTTGVYSFASAPTIDGVVPAVGNRVLVKDQVDAPQNNGIYTVNTPTSWSRASDLSQASQFVYGLRILITNGTVNAGRSVFLFNRNEYSVNAFTVNVHRVAFNFEPSPNPDVALLTAAPITVSNSVVIANNCSAGASTLGGATADASTFKGTVTLNRDVQLTAAGGGAVTFAGAISGNYGIVKVGSGTVCLTGVNTYTGVTAVSAGVLVATNSAALGASSNVTVAAGAELDVSSGGWDFNGSLTVNVSSNSAGVLTVGGGLTLGADSRLAVGAGSLFDRSKRYAVVTYAARTGTFGTSDALPQNWHVGYYPDRIELYYSTPGTLIAVW